MCGKDSDGCAAQRDLDHVVFGIYSINVEGGDATTIPADVGIVIEGVEVLHDLGDLASACALLMGVIYAVNLSYPQELKTFFEVLQKIFLQLDATRLSTKVQMLKNKLYEWTNIERVARGNHLIEKKTLFSKFIYCIFYFVTQWHVSLS